MVLEFLISGATIVGCAWSWAFVTKHKLEIELQRHKITTDYESIKPIPEPAPPAKPLRPVFAAKQQSLTALLSRREVLEQQISELRERAMSFKVEYGRDSLVQHRADSLKALEDARKEQQELVLEQVGLLEMMKGDESEDPSRESVRIDTGTNLARRVDDPCGMHDAELHDEEASGEGASEVHEGVANSAELSTRSS